MRPGGLASNFFRNFTQSVTIRHHYLLMNLFFNSLRSKIFISIICVIMLAFALMNAVAQSIEATPEGKCREYQIYVLEVMENHNYEDGINKGREILKEVEKLEGGKGMNYSKVLSELSILYDRVGKYDKAIEYAKRLAMLAVPLFKSGEVKKSIEYTKQALTILESETGKSNEGLLN